MDQMATHEGPREEEEVQPSHRQADVYHQPGLEKFVCCWCIRRHSQQYCDLGELAQVATGRVRSASVVFAPVRPTLPMVGKLALAPVSIPTRILPLVQRCPSLRRPKSSFTSADRVSRVSFAEGTRPSGEVRRSTAGHSRAFHHSFVPPIPTLNSDEGLTDRSMSPTQTQGPESLTIEAIRARVANGDISVRASMDEELSPAISSTCLVFFCSVGRRTDLYSSQ